MSEAGRDIRRYQISSELKETEDHPKTWYSGLEIHINIPSHRMEWFHAADHFSFDGVAINKENCFQSHPYFRCDLFIPALVWFMIGTSLVKFPRQLLQKGYILMWDTEAWNSQAWWIRNSDKSNWWLAPWNYTTGSNW